jgi:hypothetical protein
MNAPSSGLEFIDADEGEASMRRIQREEISEREQGKY